MSCCSVICLASLLGDFLLCRVLVGRLNPAGLPLLHVILSLDDMIEQLLWLCHQQNQSQHLPWPDQTAPQENHGDNQNNPTMPIQHTNNYLIPDEGDRRIHDIQHKTFYRGILENGLNAYLLELPDLKPLLRISRYLMDEVTGQFYAGNSYQCMCTIPRLTHT